MGTGVTLGVTLLKCDTECDTHTHNCRSGTWCRLCQLKTEIDWHFSDLNPFNYCPLVIVQVVRSSDNALNNFSHLIKCVVMTI